ncbi:hypothetical protein [Massilia scottii]|uniref:hypothetical protein n=1 Tax=Massilia scottii TaxID=3057166 RepID=UPI0027964F8A|nr:hypothetical protein [Massilia sp. CCM 9029]MDQ1832181.1 hypothetical protein [Massilia sp. CCM 9029]
MPFPTLNTYLAHLSDPNRPASSVWLDSAGRAQGKYFNCTITSAFQPIRALGSSRIVPYEGLARSGSAGDAGLSLWKLLDHAASDDESIELDRLCRMLHAIKFDARYLSGGVSLAPLLEAARAAGVKLIFKRVETAPAIDSAEDIAGLPLYAQGYYLDQPQAALVAEAALAA